MALPRRLLDVDAAGHRQQPGAFTLTAAELKRDRIKAYAIAFEMQRPLPYQPRPDAYASAEHAVEHLDP